MPKEFSLEQNYPNPFNPSTTVTFKMPKDVSVRLEVFSLLGQRIKVLAEGPYEAGVHQVVWMGDDERGARVASGVYFCRFVNGKNSVQTKKMLLTK
jgi:flagellar hook assembly protein FlgD